MQIRKDGLLLLAFVQGLAFPLLAQSAVLRVPADVPTIQAAIDAAVDGDEVVVAPGSYEVALNFAGKAITVRSEQGMAATSLHNNYLSNTAAPIVTFNHGEGPASVLRGFTFFGIRIADFPVVEIDAASPTLLENRFYFTLTSSTVVMRSSNARLQRNLFFGNSCGPAVADANVSISADSSPTLANNVFYNNRTCVALAVDLSASSSPRIFNNTVLDGRGGVRMSMTGAATGQAIFRNNVIARRVDENGANTFGLDIRSGTELVVWENNLVYGVEQPYLGIADQTGSSGNLMIDPGLSGREAMDFRPDTGAPVIDVGLAGEVQPGDLDYYGNARINPATNLVDLGAAEYFEPTPTVSISLTPTSILQGQTAELVWSSTGAESCVASGTGWSGTRPLQGSLTVNPSLGGNWQYVLTCTLGVVRRSASVTLHVEPAPSIRFNVNPNFSRLALGDPLVFEWQVQHATSCVATGDWSGTKPLTGTETFRLPLGSYEYEFTCTGPGGVATKSVAVTVIAAPTLTMSIEPGSIVAGQSATLRWTAENVTSCTSQISGFENIPTSGERVLSGLAPGTYRYDIVCVTPIEYRTMFANATLTVTAAPTPAPQPPPTTPTRRGGGGAIGLLWALLLFALAAARRRMHRHVSITARS
jgi:hypothetical protein